LVKWITLPDLVDYQEGIKIMEDQLDRVINSMQSDTIFLLEHKEVYTAGTSHNVEELLKPDLFPVIYTGRGGKFTYHGPGQRIIYPIINLNNTDKVKDLKRYITQLEKWIILTLAELGVHAFTIQGKVGIWVKNSRNIESKIGAIGIRVRKWVTYHGIAVNISPNLDNYSGIIPCGINDFPITSLEDMGINISMTEFDIILKKKFIEIF
jgi:lipoyl(octanoyl) transferase